jgi:tricorn protease
MPGCLGADFVWDGAANGYRCTHIVCGDRWDAFRGGPLAKPGVNVAVGDILCKVNGIALTESLQPEKALLGCAGQEAALVWIIGVEAQNSIDDIAGAMQMLFLNDTHKTAAVPAQRDSDPRSSPSAAASPGRSSSAKKKKKKKNGGGREDPPQKQQTGREHRVTVRALAGDRYARYVDEISSRRLHVHTSTEGRVGYIHLPDCERLGFAEFHRHYLTESRRDGLVLDVRGNEGGHISDLLLEKVCTQQPAEFSAFLHFICQDHCSSVCTSEWLSSVLACLSPAFTKGVWLGGSTMRSAVPCTGHGCTKSNCPAVR